MMEERPNGKSALARYWPVLLVVVVVLGVVGVAALRGGDDKPSDNNNAAPNQTVPIDDGDGDGENDSPGTGESDDPMDAPDCDPETGRIMVPSLFAPNCMALWDDSQDNGGATYQGVTGDSITVVVYGGQLDANTIEARELLGLTPPSPEEHAENRLRMVGVYNDLFETYGRTVKVEVLETNAGGTDEVAARADAIRAAEEMKAFAVIGGPANTPVFAEELASRGVLCFCTSSLPIERYLEWAPYVWGGLMSSTQGYVHRADLVIQQLAGNPAEFAGDPAMQTKERTFGLVWYETPDGAYKDGVDFFVKLLAEDNVSLTENMSYLYGAGGANLDEDAQAIIARLKAAGVTSVLFAGDPFMPISLTKQATAQDYWPEWIVTGSVATDVSDLARQYDQEQWAHAFGISFTLPIIDPALTQREGNIYSWHLGEELSTYPESTEWNRVFTGIHLAGPNLTPETFRDGMFSFKPVSGHPTQYAVSFGTGLWQWEDYTAADDIKAIWWDSKERDPRKEGEEVLGVYKVVNGGERYLPGELDTIDGFFKDAGSIIWFQERPASDQPPQYPPRSGRAG